MRLLFVIPSIVSYEFLRELLGDLVADGTEVHLACTLETNWGRRQRAAQEGVQRHNIQFARGMNPLAHWRAARELNRLVERIQPDLIHVHFSAAIFTVALARTRRWPATIGTFHGVCFPAMGGWKAALLRVMETWAAQRLDAAWVLTDDDREHLQAAAPRAVVRRLPGFGLGCNLAEYAPPTPREREAARARHGLSADEVVFVFVGRFVNFKGFATAVGAFLRLAEINPAARLMLVGTCDKLHPTGLTSDQEQALKHSPQVLDLGFCTDVASCLSAADVMIFPSRREGMSVCLMESLAAGVPAITSDARGCREVVRDGIDGRVISEPSGEKFFAAMQQAAANGVLRRAWSEAALAGRERFDRQRFVEIQKRIYREAAGQPAAELAVSKVATSSLA